MPPISEARSAPPRREPPGTLAVGMLLLTMIFCAPAPSSAQTVAAACDTLSHLVAGVPSLVVSGRDALVLDELQGRTAPGCLVRFAGRVSAFRGATSPDELLRETLAARGWSEQLQYDADGPDGTAFAFTKGPVMCLIRAGWDGGDDSDPSYVPEDRYELVIGCVAKSH